MIWRVFITFTKQVGSVGCNRQLHIAQVSRLSACWLPPRMCMLLHCCADAGYSCGRCPFPCYAGQWTLCMLLM